MSSKAIKILFSVGAVILILIRVIRPYLLSSDALTLGLLIVAILPWLSSFIDTAEFPGGWKVSFRRLEAEQKRQKSEIDSLRFLVSAFLTDDELTHLKKLAIGDDFSYNRNDRFVAELRRLRDLGLIRKTSATHIRDLPEKGYLKNYLQITNLGHTYLRLRTEVEEMERNEKTSRVEKG